MKPEAAQRESDIRTIIDPECEDAPNRRSLRKKDRRETRPRRSFVLVESF